MQARGRENLSNNFFMKMTDRWKLIKMKDAARRMMIMLGWITVQQTLKQTKPRQSMNLSDFFCDMQRKYESSPKSTDVNNFDIMLMCFISSEPHKLNQPIFSWYSRHASEVWQTSIKKIPEIRQQTFLFSVVSRELSNTLFRLMESF